MSGPSGYPTSASQASKGITRHAPGVETLIRGFFNQARQTSCAKPEKRTTVPNASGKLIWMFEGEIQKTASHNFASPPPIMPICQPSNTSNEIIHNTGFPGRFIDSPTNSSICVTVFGTLLNLISNQARPDVSTNKGIKYQFTITATLSGPVPLEQPNIRHPPSSTRRTTADYQCGLRYPYA